MPVLRFLRRAPPGELVRMAVLTAVAGVANALLLAVANHVAGLVAGGERPGLGSWVWFLVAFGVYFACERAALLRSNAVIETLLEGLRLEVADRVRRSELGVIERLDRSSLYALVAQETNHLSMVFPVLVDCVQQATLLVCSLAYLAWLSVSALLLFVVAALVGILAYVRIATRLEQILVGVGALQARMLDGIDGIIDGFKEQKLHRARSDSVYAAFAAHSRDTEALLVEFGSHWVWMMMISGLVCYYLLATATFVFPQYIPGHPEIVFALTPTILFCMGPMTKLVGVAPMVARANVGFGAIEGALAALEAGGGVDPAAARAGAGRYRDFGSLALRRVEFHHRDAAGRSTFRAGPLDLEVRRGEVVFLVGGNGSGKSTALRLLTGLYPPEAGEVAVDGRALGPGEVAGYRELFSAVFADFHLFDRLYGLGAVDEAAVASLIETMGLASKVAFRDGRFSDLALSTGQRKRLALIASILEDRPVHVFDEWPAEQDQEFREHFYLRILPMLKARGKTVIAATHDDRYWHVADRVLRLDLGTVSWEKPGAALAPGA